jgi:hypothetical protein
MTHQNLKLMTYLKHYSISIFVLFLFSCKSSNSFSEFVEKENLSSEIDTIFILPENFCKSCVYHTEELFYNNKKFRKNIKGYFLTEEKNQFFTPSISNNFSVIEYSQHPKLKINNFYIYIIKLDKKKVLKVDSIASAEYYDILPKLIQ